MGQNISVDRKNLVFYLNKEKEDAEKKTKVDTPKVDPPKVGEER